MLRSAIFLQLMVLAGGVAVAQEISHQEVTLGGAGSTDTPGGGTPSAGNGQYRIPLTGPILRYSFNVNRAFAVESSVTDSVDAVALNDHEGGHQILALAGVKVGVRRRWFGVYGTS